MAYLRSQISRILLATAAITLSSTAGYADKANDTLVYASDSEPETISPYHGNLREGVIVARHVFDSLIARNTETGKYEPQLATSWNWADPQTLDVTIRKGVTFHNGDPLSADDVVFTLNYVVSPEAKVVTKQNVSWIKSAEKIGEDQVRIHLVAPFPAAIEYLAGPVVIYPEAYFKKVGLDGFSREPVGSGPYKITSVMPGKGVKMEKNENYWEGSPLGKPQIGKLEFRIIPDPETQVAELITGGVDWIWRVQADQAGQMSAVPNIDVLAAETMRVGFLQLDATGRSPGSAPLKDARVRQAISYAIDRNAIVDNLVRGGARVMHSACFIDQVGCTDDGVPRYDYNPEKAKQLLAEAGFPNGFSIDLYAYREREYAEAVVGYLAAVGIKAKLNILKYAALRDLSRSGKVPIFFQTWGSYSVADASAFTGVWFKGDEDDLSRNQELTDLLKKADGTVEEANRQALYSQALKLIAEQAYLVPMFSYSTNYAFTSDLNFTAQPDELPRFFKASWK